MLNLISCTVLLFATCAISGYVRERGVISRVLGNAFRGNGESDVTGDVITADNRMNDEDLDIELDTVDLLQRLVDADRNYARRAEDWSGLADQDIPHAHGRSRRQCWYCGGGTGTKGNSDTSDDDDDDGSIKTWWG